jgi:hypothetical protein
MASSGSSGSSPSSGTVSDNGNTDDSNNDDETCTAGPVQCCQSLQDPISAAVSSLLDLLGFSRLTGLEGPIGLTCKKTSRSPRTIVIR